MQDGNGGKRRVQDTAYAWNKRSPRVCTCPNGSLAPQCLLCPARLSTPAAATPKPLCSPYCTVLSLCAPRKVDKLSATVVQSLFSAHAPSPGHSESVPRNLHFSPGCAWVLSPSLTTTTVAPSHPVDIRQDAPQPPHPSPRLSPSQHRARRCRPFRSEFGVSR